MFGSKPKSAAEIAAKNLRYYGVKCLYHPSTPCTCAARKAKRKAREAEQD